MVYFALPVAQLFLQGVDQRFLFGQALFQQVPTTYLVDTTLSDASDYDQTVHAVRLQ